MDGVRVSTTARLVKTDDVRTGRRGRIATFS
jgi:hypothetical protein